MDSTPQTNLGFGPSSHRRILNFNCFESTPIQRNRKRKSTNVLVPECIRGRILSNVIESPQTDKIADENENNSYDVFHKHLCSKLLTSENSFDANCSLIKSDCVKLSSSLEKCSLDDFKFEPKRRKSAYKSNSAPTTPSRLEKENVLGRYKSFEFTPTKESVKLGTPERNKILYSKLIEVKSPEKKRNEIRRYRLKKRLFVCHDFVFLFSKMTNNIQIINKILSYLTDSDLMNVRRVSTLWKSMIENNGTLYKRYKSYVRNRIISKENIPLSLSLKFNDSKKGNSINSPLLKGNFSKVLAISQKLLPNQQLAKCILCTNNAVKVDRIVLCLKSSCQYIYCIRCLSGSRTGHENFMCRCIDCNPKVRNLKANLSDISNSIDISLTSSEFSGLSTNSSGYYTQSISEDSSTVLMKDKSIKKKNILNDSNKNVRVESRANDCIDFNAIQELGVKCMNQIMPRIVEYEPTSPPKIKKQIIGSIRSKKNLKRL